MVAAAQSAEPLGKGFPNRRGLTIFLATKALTVAAFLLFFFGFDHMHGANLWNRWYSGPEVLDAIYLPFANWDGQNYLLIAERGYLAPSAQPAFFPLYPLAIRAAQLILVDIYVSAFVVNLLLSFLFCYIFHRYAEHFLPERDASGALVLVLTWPTAFFLTALYTEALFLLLLFGFLYFYDLRKSRLSLPFAFLLPLARAQTAFVIAALVIVIVIRRLQGKPIDYRYEVSNMAAFAAGALCYLGFFQVAVGDAFAGISDQNNFVFGNSLMNLFNPGHFLAYLFAETRGWFSYTYSLTDKIFVIASLLASVIVARTKNLLWLVLYVMLLYPAAAMGGGGSFSRFTLAAAPILVLAVWSLYAGRARIIYAIGAAFAVAQLFFVWRFALNLWVA